MTNEPGMTDDDITTDAPTESGDNLDKGGEGPLDTGDEPTEDDENLDKGGDGPQDSGDEA